MRQNNVYNIAQCLTQNMYSINSDDDDNDDDDDDNNDDDDDTIPNTMRVQGLPHIKTVFYLVLCP